MCGIGGLWDPAGRHAPDHAQLQRLMSAIGHRGPEGAAFARGDRGALILGFLQLGFTDGGVCLQPMSDDAGLHTLAFNGEIYDHAAIRAQLQARGHRFHTQSDTEVLLHLYVEEGRRCFDRLNGEFAFAIWDAKAEELTLVRDRFGVKPLFYAWHRGAFVFASEAKGILALEGFPAELDPAYFTGPGVGLADCARSPFLGISIVRPGNALRVSRRRVTEVPYWHPRFGEHAALTRDVAAEGVREVVTRAVARRLEGNPPIALSLSSGVDSSIVCGLMAQHGRKPTAFSVGYEGQPYDESRQAEATARHFGLGFERVACTPESLAEHFLTSAHAIEVPTNSLTATARIRLTAAVRATGHKALMSGEGSDELFGGYPYFGLEAIWRMPEGAAKDAALQRFARDEAGSRGIFWDDPTPSAYDLRVRRTQRDSRWLFSRGFRARMGEHTALSTAQRELPHSASKHLDPFDATRVIARSVLSSLVIPGLGDRVEMASSLEGRVPFLDRDVVQFAYGLTEAHCLDAETGVRKAVLRHAFAGMLPRGMRPPAKTTLMAPSWASFARTRVGSGLVERLLSDRAVRHVGVFDPSFVRLLKLGWKLLPEGGRRHTQLDLLAGYVLSTHALHHVLVEDALGKRTQPLLALTDDRTPQRQAQAVGT